jgi:hypothetical protein
MRPRAAIVEIVGGNMVFHGDYEVEFEIYKVEEGSIRSELLGHMAGITADDAKARWAEAQKLCESEEAKIIAVVPVLL